MYSIDFAIDAWPQAAWLDVTKLNDWLSSRGVTFLRKGSRHNQTDGEVHYIYQLKNEELFELIANLWDYKTCQPILDRVEEGENHDHVI